MRGSADVNAASLVAAVPITVDGLTDSSAGDEMRGPGVSPDPSRQLMAHRRSYALMRRTATTAAAAAISVPNAKSVSGRLAFCSGRSIAVLGMEASPTKL